MEQSYGFPSNFFPRQIFFLSPISEKTFVLEQSLNEIHSFDQKVGNPEIDAKLSPYTKNSYGSQKVCKKVQILMQKKYPIQRILMVVKRYAKSPDFDAN